MNYEFLRCDIENKVATVTISHSPGNKLNTQVYQEITQIMGELEANEHVNAIVITGEGEEAFVAGADINELADLDTVGMMDLTQITRTSYSKIENLNKPVIASINGEARGGGLELALSCDLRIASEYAQFAFPEINLGVIPGGGGTQRIQKVVGQGTAKELLYFGETIDAERAYQLQIVNKVVDQNELSSTAKEWARKLAQKAPVALRMMKLAVNTGANVDLESALTIEATSYDGSFATQDRKEGIAARLENRKPNFKGR
ncbi:enoyl-CoA hydratase [Virgibacillus natechei]|uniref:Enoyl-CoA hydratase n=1 Tax=Virgibacillus natechei TaxID=1216297 RepID=A0ABS4II92_9BACI|nr:enoyl-CoA hydratase-related protein [Virgibacillus natechei]MBP1970672.1 enoyl-CoA hydratase [Virgibacillus natechei]UZD12081.1 enoyl-CoA hydratase-related protein [Virgibacillus natechei]